MNNRTQENNELLFHPYNIIVTLTLISMSMLFLATTLSYVYSRVQNGMPPIKVPILFLLNTGVLIASRYTMKKAHEAYINDDTEGYKKSLTTTLLITFLFMLLQGLAWYTMVLENNHISSSNASGYIYAISILHILHVGFGVPFMVAFCYVAYKRMKEPVSVLVYFSDPLKALKLKLLTRYWTFLDILWAFLVLFFYINYFVSAEQIATVAKFFTP
jgi:cytochrome c oxidase subunit III